MRRCARRARSARPRAGVRRRIWPSPSIPPPSFNTLLLADTGEALTEIAAVLPYYDVDRSAVQIIGPALWASPSSGSGQFRGAWYAAPDPAARANFEQAYTAQIRQRRRRRWPTWPTTPPRSRAWWAAAAISVGRADPAGRVRRRRWLVRAAVGRSGAPGAGGVRHRARRAADGRAGAAVGQCAGGVTSGVMARRRFKPLHRCTATKCLATSALVPLCRPTNRDVRVLPTLTCRRPARRVGASPFPNWPPSLPPT